MHFCSRQCSQAFVYNLLFQSQRMCGIVFAARSACPHMCVQVYNEPAPESANFALCTSRRLGDEMGNETLPSRR